MKALALILLLGSCSDDSPGWPSGGQSSVEGRWCEASCDRVALLTDELLEGEGRLTRYLFVWTQESWPQLSSPNYHVGYFVEVAPHEFHDLISTHIATDMTFDHQPSFDEVAMTMAQRMPITGKLICGEVHQQEWLRVVGATIGDFGVMPCE